MKVLITSMYYRPENLPINSVVDLLKKNGVEIDVLTAKPNYPEGKFYMGYGIFSKIYYQEEGLGVYRLPIFPRGKRKITLALNYLSFVVSGVLMAPFLLRKKNYDLIFVYANSPITKTIPAILLAKLKKTPVIVWVQDLWPESILYSGIKLPGFLISIIRYITKLIYLNVDVIATQSQSFNKKISNDFGIETNKIIHLPNTIDSLFLTKQSDAILPDQFTNNLGRFNIVFTGNIGDAQNLDDLIAASNSIKKKDSSIKFFIIGAGSKLEEYRELVSSKNIENIFFLGSFPLSYMPSFIAKSDLMLISLKDEEIYNLTIPNKLQSYMASGKPVLGNISGASADLIEKSKCGHIVKPNNPDLLCNKIIEMSRLDRRSLELMGNNGKLYFEDHFSNESFLNNFFSLLDKRV